MADNITTPEVVESQDIGPEIPSDTTRSAQTVNQTEPDPASSEQEPIRSERTRRSSSGSNDVVTLDRMSVPDPYSTTQDIAWHDLKDSQIRGKILTGTLVSTERHRIKDHYVYISIVDYQGYRVIIPTKEMNINTENNDEYRANMIVQNMIGCGIDFIVTQLDEEARSAGASRKRAMKKKIEDFYKTPSASTGMPIIQKGTIVEARIVAVSQKVLRLEVFGAECFTNLYDLDNAWIANARSKYSVGDTINVRMQEIEFKPAGDGNEERLQISVEAKSLGRPDTYRCTEQSKYLGTVTGFSKGIYFLRLTVGANAIAHSVSPSCRPLPREGDQVTYVCTKVDAERNTAIGLITRVVKPARRDPF